MRAGYLDRRATLQHRVLTRSATTGDEVVTYTDYATVWAGKKDIRGREFWASQQVNSDITTMWQIRHRTDVVATDRIVVEGLSYDISGIAEIGRRDGLELQATAVQP